MLRSLCVLSVLVLPTAAVPPWTLVPAGSGRTVELGLTTHGVALRSITFGDAGEEPFSASLRVKLEAPTARRLLVAVFDARRRPLAADVRPLEPRFDGSLTVTLGGAAVAAEVAFVACGVEPIAVPTNSLIAAANGGQVVAMSSCYGGGYGPETLLDGDAATVWASATGQVADQWFVIQVPGGPQLIAAVGINPTGEPSYRACAVREWMLLASATGAEPADFAEVLSGTCEVRDELQRFELPEPVAARYLKLVCRTNRGSDRWMELTEFEAYAPTGGEAPPEPPAEPLVRVLEDFERTPSGRSRAADRLGELEMMGGRQILAVERDASREEIEAAGSEGPWPVYRLNCREARAEVVREADSPSRFARLIFDFGNLLGGAPQYVATIFSLPLEGQPARLQLTARAARPGNLLRSTVWDSRNEWFLFQYAKIDWRGWRQVSIDLDPARAVMRGGEDRNGRIDWPARLMQVSVNPSGRDSVAGQIDLDNLLALSVPP